MPDRAQHRKSKEDGIPSRTELNVSSIGSGRNTWEQRPTKKASVRIRKMGGPGIELPKDSVSAPSRSGDRGVSPATSSSTQGKRKEGTIMPKLVGKPGESEYRVKNALKSPIHRTKKNAVKKEKRSRKSNLAKGRSEEEEVAEPKASKPEPGGGCRLIKASKNGGPWKKSQGH